MAGDIATATKRDIATIKKDRLRYTNNKRSANLTYLGILFNVLYFVNIYQSDVNNYYYTLTIGLSVLCNLIFLLAAFLSSEGVKNYKLGYAYTLILLGVVQVVRIFGIPRMAHSATAIVNGEEIMVMEDKQYTLVVVFLLLSAASCLAAGVNGIIKTHILTKYKKENGFE